MKPDTLTSFHRSFHRYLANEKNLPFNTLKDLEFTSSRESLKAARKMLKKQGKRNRPQAVMALSNEDIEKLWQTGALGCSSPESLMHTVWFLVCYQWVCGEGMNTKNIVLETSQLSPHLMEGNT